MRMHNPPHPGAVLRDYLGLLSVTDAAKHLGVTRVALSRILNGAAGISAEMALRLSEALVTSPELWLGMQTQYDLWRASKKRRGKVTRLTVSPATVRIVGDIVGTITPAEDWDCR